MTTLLLALLLGSLILVLLSGDWRSGLLLTVVIGFAQDPIRKLTPDQPGLYVGLALVAFVGSALVLYQRRGGRLQGPAIHCDAVALRFGPIAQAGDAAVDLHPALAQQLIGGAAGAEAGGGQQFLKPFTGHGPMPRRLSAHLRHRGPFAKRW